MIYNIKNIILIIAATILISACSTKKNTFTSRAFHNVTSRYNIYFNGREAYKTGLLGIKKDFKEPFTDILPIFYYKDKSVLTSASGNMDIALQKCTKLIKNHSITAKPSSKKPATTPKQKEFVNQKEFNKWIDDSYLLMGKAFFYKQNYFEAQKSFTFILNEYKKKPIRHEANVWLAKTKTELGLYDDAKDILDKSLEDKEFPEKLYGEIYAQYADIFIQQKKYEDAISNLILAIDQTKNKKTKTRYTYILAQLHQEIGDNAKALTYFKAIENMNPEYDMAFNAKINQATSFDGASGSSKEVIAILKKLLKDEKNIDYKDQIYFAIANVYNTENDEENAIENYILSLENSSSNKHQKAISYLAIGNIYYNQKKYLPAQPYYDSCISVLDKSYRNYDEIKHKSENLNILAYNHNTVLREDSLQSIAKMPEIKRNEYIDKIITNLIAQEAEKQKQEQEDQFNATLNGIEPGAENQNIAGKSYFYNESAVKFGKSEFIKRWGDRKLEDNWRRGAKSNLQEQTDEANNENENNGSTEKAEEKLSNKSRNFYTKDLPLTDSLIKVSNKKTEEAFFNVGMAYMNLIGDNAMAITSLEAFIKRYPTGTYTPIALYYLHILYNAEKSFSKADEYKLEVIQKYPTSNYAKALTNPSFYKDLKNRDKQLEKDYADCYKAYMRGDYSYVISECTKQISLNNESYLVPRFSLLRILADGKIKGPSTLKNNLQLIIKNYPNDEIAAYAKSLLESLQTITSTPQATESLVDETKPTENATPAPEQVEIYTYKDNVPHYFIIVAKSEFVSINRIKFNIINYNLDYFTNFNFIVNSKDLNSKLAILQVGMLTDNNQALNYLELVNYNPDVFEGVEKVFTEQYIISEDNYKALLIDKDIEKYKKFFNENYSR